MSILLKIITKSAGSLLVVLVFLFAACKGPVDSASNDDNGYQNPNGGISRQLAFSHNSGLYPQQFNLTLTAPPGSTIYYSTDGSYPDPAKADMFNSNVFTYSASIVIKNRNGQPNVLATMDNILQMYPKDNELWSGYKPTNYVPTNNQVPKATVIRAMAVDSNGIPSTVLTKTYFIGNNLASYQNIPVISLVTDPQNLVNPSSDPATGGIMVRGADTNKWLDTSISSIGAYNFQQDGSAWERPAYLEIFDGTGSSRSVPVSTGVGIRIHGAYSRANAQKALNVYFRTQYGINSLQNYNLIPGAVKADGKTPVGRYNSFVLQNGGGQDTFYTKYYDVFTQNLLKDRSFGTQAGVPCVVYLNGEYWGPYNISEKYSNNGIEYKYGVSKDNVIAIKTNALAEGNPGDEARFTEMITLGTSSGNYDAFCKLVDIDNFIDYCAAEIYINNEDWPHSNYYAWRTRTNDGTFYGDTRWRWQMFDVEWALGSNSDGNTTGDPTVGGYDGFSAILSGRHTSAPVYNLIKALLANDRFCRQLVNTILDLYNVNFNPVNYAGLLNNYYVPTYRRLMMGPSLQTSSTPGYFDRWGASWGADNTLSWIPFEYQTENLTKYLTDIRTYMVTSPTSYLSTYFGGNSIYPGVANIHIQTSDLHNVTVKALGASGASVKINTVTPNLPWTGQYYSTNPITVTANVPPGYTFNGWTATPGATIFADASSPTTTVSGYTGDVTITANFK